MGILSGKQKLSSKDFVAQEEAIKRNNEYQQNEINKKALRRRVKELER